jgi:hypothetical protein
MQGKTGATVMVAADGVDHQFLGGDRQGADGLFERRAFAEGEQGGR